MALPFLDLPIVLAPMGGTTDVRFATAASACGVFPIYPCAYLTPAQITEHLAQLRAATQRPIGANLFVEALPYARDDQRIAHAHERLRPFRDALGLAQPDVPASPPEHYAAQIDAVLAAHPDVFTFTFGIPDAETLARFRDAGIFTMGTATTVAEARALRDAGVDGIIAQGSEAGAHRGTFFAPVSASLVGTLALVPQIVDETGLPVIATGGIADGRGVAAVLALGAEAAAIGTAFILADESAASAAYRAALASPDAQETVLTRAFSGRTARGIANRVTRELRDPDDLAPYPFQNAMTRDIRNAAAARADREYLSLWAGQAASLARSAPIAELVASLMTDAGVAVDRASIVLAERA